MKYETIGGQIHDTNYHVMTIRELKIGDIFTMKNSKSKYRVLGEKCIWSTGGTSLRKVLNLDTIAIEFKRCNSEITKVK
jgi:hypothetical protein